MKYFDKEKWRQSVQKEFVEIDKFNNQFFHTFSNTLHPVFGKFHSIKNFDGNFNEFLSIYAIHLLSLIESVIEKDRNYSQYRIGVELERMNELVSKISKPRKYPKLDDELIILVKNLTIDFFPIVYEFTGDGFRLLEINLKLFTRDIHTDFEFGVKNKLNPIN